jgi:hypothetical protein
MSLSLNFQREMVSVKGGLLRYTMSSDFFGVDVIDGYREGRQVILVESGTVFCRKVAR